MRTSRLTRVSTVLALVCGLVTAPGSPARADAVRDAQWHLGFLNVSQLHAITQGEGITVAVLDTGVDQTQPDLAGSVLPGRSGVTEGQDGRTDPDGHGTRVSSLIAGHGHGSGGASGILGLAPKAKILPYTIYETDDPKGMKAAVRAAEGIVWAVQQGADVICIASAGGGTPQEEEAITYTLARGVPIIAGVSNLPETTTGFPAAYRGVVAVSSVNRQGDFASEVSVTSDSIQLSAPGANIPAPKPGGGYTEVSGNSAATGITAGVVALLRAKYPALTPAQILQHLKATATDRGSVGKDNQYGYGVINPLKALTQEPVDPSASASDSPAQSNETDPFADLDTDRDTGYSTGQVAVGFAILALVLIAVVCASVILVLRLRRRRRQGP
ncbi:MAG: S8 family serine peptidase [Micromonosporaceae bacterium]|nr:S8 family serine peptidase [Micromonosporaceae bacterium]